KVAVDGEGVLDAVVLEGEVAEVLVVAAVDGDLVGAGGDDALDGEAGVLAEDILREGVALRGLAEGDAGLEVVRVGGALGALARGRAVEGDRPADLDGPDVEGLA